MTPHENDPLVACLAELAAELDRENIPVILGGGLSQYLRGKLDGGRSPRYPFAAPARSTEDLDLFLSPPLRALHRIKFNFCLRTRDGTAGSAH